MPSRFEKSVASQFSALERQKASEAEREGLRHCDEGADRVRSAASEVLEGVIAQGEAIPLAAHRLGRSIVLRASKVNYALAITVVWGRYSNTVDDVSLRVGIWHGATPYEPHGHHGKLKQVSELQLAPDFAPGGGVLWLGAVGHAESHVTQELPERLLRWFAEGIRKEESRSGTGHR